MRLISFLGLAALVLVGCGHEVAKPAPTPPAPIIASLALGTPIKLVLLGQMESGVSEKGSEVPLMVSEDVSDSSGHVLIAKGTPAKGEITWSRREGTMGALMKQPARLDFKLVSLSTVDGQSVELSADASKPEEFRFDRENTGYMDGTSKFDDLIKEQGDNVALKDVADLFADGKTPDLNSPATKEKLKQVCQRLSLHETERLIDKGEVDKASTLLRQVKQGASIATIGAGGALAAVGAVTELAALAGRVTNHVSGMLQGRNIRAYVGTPFTAYALKGITVTIRN